MNPPRRTGKAHSAATLLARSIQMQFWAAKVVLGVITLVAIAATATPIWAAVTGYVERRGDFNVVITMLVALAVLPMEFGLVRLYSLTLAHTRRLLSQAKRLHRDEAIVELALKSGQPQLAIEQLMASAVHADDGPIEEQPPVPHTRAEVVPIDAARKRRREAVTEE